MIRKKLDNFVCLDIGSHKLALLVAKIYSAFDLSSIHYSLYSSCGFKAGIVEDAKEATNSLSTALYNVEKYINTRIEDVVVVLSGAYTRSHYVTYSLPLDGHSVTDVEINKIMSKAVKAFSEKDRSVLHCFGIEFVVDEQEPIHNPIGIIGNKLTVSLHVITASANALLNITNALAKCHINVEEFILSPIAVGYAFLKKNKQEFYFFVIDCGAMTTSFTFFYGDTPIFTDYISIGGWHISNDIAQVLSISFDEAEKLKILYTDLRDTASMVTLDFECTSTVRDKINSSMLNEIVRARLIETFSLIKSRLEALKIEPIMLQKVIISGAAQVPGIEALCGSILCSDNVRDFSLYYDESILSNQEPVNTYASVLGGLAYRMKYYRNYYSSIISSKDRNGILSKLGAYIKNILK